MGGMGSGRRYQGGKDTTSDMRPLDIRRLQRDGLLTPGRAFVPGVNYLGRSASIILAGGSEA